MKIGLSRFEFTKEQGEELLFVSQLVAGNSHYVPSLMGDYLANGELVFPATDWEPSRGWWSVIREIPQPSGNVRYQLDVWLPGRHMPVGSFEFFVRNEQNIHLTAIALDMCYLELVQGREFDDQINHCLKLFDGQKGKIYQLYPSQQGGWVWVKCARY